MRLLRRLSFLLFLASLGIYAAYHYKIEIGKDHTSPVIHIAEDTITVSVNATDEELLAGITAEDNRDGDVTGNLFIERLNNFTTEGTRKCTIACYDSAGNVTKATRTVSYSDYVKPHFTMEDDLRFPVGTTDILTNLGAEDVIDGDISERVKVTGTYTMANSAGDYPMEFSVSNKAGDVVYLTATVTLYDNSTELSSPSIVLKDYIVYTKINQKISPWDYVEEMTVSRTKYERSGSTLDPEVEISENSSLPQRIGKSDLRIKDGIDYTKPGCYEVTYQYTYNNSTGTARLVVVVEE